MKRLSLSIGVLLLLAGNVFGQVNCDSTVFDPVGVLGKGTAAVESNANALIQQGADVRVRTVLNGSNLDLVEKSMESACPSWQSANGSRKTTLVVLMVAPNERKMGIYYGAAFNTALASHWNRIKQEYMAPNFKAGDYATGFASAEAQLAKRIAASQDEALHPATSTTINQQAATDYSGLWSFFKWLLFFGSFGAMIWTIVHLIKARRDAGEAVAQAQTRAIAARNRAARLVNGLVTDTKIPAAKQAAFDLLIESYSQFSSSVKSDPEQSGLSAADYSAIGNMYQSISNQLMELVAPPRAESSSRVPPVPPAPKSNVKQTTKAKAASHTTANRSTVREYHDTTVIPVFVEHTSLDDIPTTHSKPSRSSSSDSDSGGGGSSSWSSSDSSSSSSSWGDSGGSSSFDSGGGDSGGGGGSSDF